MKKRFTLLSLLFAFNIWATDFVEYTCLTDRVTISGFRKMRIFDKEGIMKTKKVYNPLVIAQYGILAYYSFIETRDSSYYFECINQVKFFKDTSKVDAIINDKGIGLPYDFKYKDMKAPWYSGMTQGYATSFLLRYHDLTHDDSILPIIKKIVYVLISPQEDGGTISITKEGFKWIEEYPNSRNSPGVLNGSLNGFIGLKEYCDYFTKDEVAHDMLDQVYLGMVNSLALYDTPEWSYYNRKSRKISNLYLRYQFHQMKQLYAIYHDPIFDHQMRIWGMMVYGKKMKNKSKMYKLRDLELCVPSEQNKDGYHQCPVEVLKPVNSGCILIHPYKKLKHISANKELKEGKTSKLHFIRFDQPDSLNKMGSFNYVQFEVYKSEDVKEVIVYKKQNGTYAEIPSIQREYADRYTIYTDSCNLDNYLLSIEYNKKKKGDYSDFKFRNVYESNLPFLSYFIADTMKLNAGETYQVNLPKENTERTVILYRYASRVELFMKTNWTANNFLEEEFKPKLNGFYQFAVVYDIDNPLSMVGELSLTAF